MATPEWIKKLTKDAEKRKKDGKAEDFLDKEKIEKTQKSFSERMEELKKKLRGK